MAEKLSDSAYLVLTPELHRYYPTRVIGFKITGLRKAKPKLRSGQVAVKINLNMNSSVFEEYIPQVEVEISGTDIIAPPVVEVVDPGADQ